MTLLLGGVLEGALFGALVGGLAGGGFYLIKALFFDKPNK